MAILRLKLLGGFALLDASGQEIVVLAKKPCALIAILRQTLTTLRKRDLTSDEGEGQ